MQLTIAANPRALDDESVLERVLLIAARRRLFVHHVTIQRVGERITVSLDLEVDGQMALGVAHDVASRLEQAIEEEFDGDVEVDTHIEPMETREIPGAGRRPGADRQRSPPASPAPPPPRRWCATSTTCACAPPGPAITACSIAAPTATRPSRPCMREVDALERAACAEFPTISRIIGHAEPRRRSPLVTLQSNCGRHCKQVERKNFAAAFSRRKFIAQVQARRSYAI